MKTVYYNGKDLATLNKLEERGLSIRNLSSNIKGCYTAKYRYSVNHKWYCMMILQPF